MFEYLDEVFRAYDIRGKYPEQISEAFAERLGKALGTLDYKKIVVGRDNRPGSDALKHALIKGITSAGSDVIDIDIASTPMGSMGCMYFKDADLNVVITASHLPQDKNGIKCMKKTGAAFMESEWLKLKDTFKLGIFKTGNGSVIQKHKEFREFYINESVKHAKNYFKHIPCKVVVDSAGGTSVVSEMLKKMGANVIDFPDKERDPEPRQNSVQKLMKKVADEKADIGLAFDIDADRVAGVDRHGNWIDPDFLSYAFADLILKEGDKAIYPIDVHDAVCEFTETQKHAKSIRVRIGDSFISDAMVRNKAVYGAEPSGHFFYLALTPYSPAEFFGILAAGMSETLDEKKKNAPEMFAEKLKIHLNNKFEKLAEATKEVKKKKYNILSEIDGIKFEYHGAPVLFRVSNTEEIIRITAFGSSKEQTNQLLQLAKEEFFL